MMSFEGAKVNGAPAQAVLEDGQSDDEPEDVAPLKRGITGGSGSHSLDKSMQAQRSLSEESLPHFEPNTHMTMTDFEADTVSYLAEGAMCQCFLAQKIPDSMKLPENYKKMAKSGVVIKTPTKGGLEVAENDLIVESVVLRALTHPHIISLLGSGITEDGSSFIVIEFLTGGTLRARLDKCGGGLGIGSAVKYGAQLASALAYMHDDAMPGTILIHRDLKPDNIGFAPNGDAKLMDFGLAKAVQRTVRCGSVKYSMTGETGSPRYMSPEVAQRQPYNGKADVWSFTIILWEMVSGRLPFAGMNLEMFLIKVCEDGERPVLQNQWPADFKNLLKAGWSTDPDKRPSFREINAILTGLQQDMTKPKKKGPFGWG